MMLQPPSVFDGASEVAAVSVLLIEFAMFRTQLVHAQIRLYALQSLILATLALAVAITRGSPELYGIAVLSIALKVWLIPRVMQRLLKRSSAR